MIDVLAWVVVVGCLLLALIGFGTAIAQRVPGWVNVIGAAVIELVLLVLAAAAVIALLTGTRLAETGTFVGYILAAVLILPFAILWAAAEKSRWSGVVLAIAHLALAVVGLRLAELWSPLGG